MHSIVSSSTYVCVHFQKTQGWMFDMGLYLSMRLPKLEIWKRPWLVVGEPIGFVVYNNHCQHRFQSLYLSLGGIRGPGQMRQ